MKALRPLHRVLAVVAACAGLLPAAWAQTNPVNDTGIYFCRYHDDGSIMPVDPTTTCAPLPVHGAQDARYGRDAAAVKGVLPKVGDSSLTDWGTPNGFDYTKVSNAGNDLPATAALGSGPDDWACTRDNHTGLLWEVKVDDPTHLRHMGHRYTWYFSTNTHGGPGIPAATTGTATCQTLGRCDTEKFVADVNASNGGQGLCGHTDWRLPTKPELFNLANRGRRAPAIDHGYFPNTPDSIFWSGSPFAGDPDQAWGMYFGHGDAYWYLRGNTDQVRLVRAGQ